MKIVSLKTEEKILVSAQKEFAQYGFDGARIDRIAKKAGVNKAMIYYYYKNKESLYELILNTLYSSLFTRLNEATPADATPDVQLMTSINTFLDYLGTVDDNYIRIMLREIASGGKYFKKVALPNLIVPVLTMMSTIIEKGKHDGIFKDIHNRFTFFTIVGATVFFNAIRIIIGDTDTGKLIFEGNFRENFKKNLLTILTQGILK